MTYASRDTTTGLNFEKQVYIQHTGINVSKNELYKYLKKHHIKWEDYISRKLLPDEAYIENDTLYIYEKKFQQVQGSADEKLQTCGFKIQQFKKIAKALGAKSVSYTYIFNDWFKKPEYKDMLEYIRSVEGCDYKFEEEIINGN